MNQPRPTVTPEIKLAAEMALDQLIDADAAGQFAADLARYAGRNMDGYQCAKNMERCGWDVNFRIAEALDGYSGIIDKELRKAEAKWAKDNAIAAPYETDTRVSLPRVETCIITGIYSYGPAKYEIAIDGDPSAAPPRLSRRIVNFEDVTPIAVEAAP